MYSLYVQVNAGGFTEKTAPDSDMLRPRVAPRPEGRQ